MSVVIIAALIGLAFLDASTLSTLLIPLWLLARPGSFTPRRPVTYLVVTAGTYFLLGLAVLLADHKIIDAYLATLQGPLASRIALGLGVVVIIIGIICLLQSRRGDQPGHWRS